MSFSRHDFNFRILSFKVFNLEVNLVFSSFSFLFCSSNNLFCSNKDSFSLLIFSISFVNSFILELVSSILYYISIS